MDWNKSNTILIIAFLIVNILLFGFIYIKGDFYNKYFDDDEQFIENVKQTLKQKNIEIDCKIPKERYTMPFLDIKYDIVYPDRELIERFIGKYEGIVTQDKLAYSNENETIQIIDRKRIVYTYGEQEDFNNADIKFYENGSSNELEKNKEIVSNFVKEKGIFMEDYHLDPYFYSGDNMILGYVKKYEKINLENSYMIFIIKNDRVVHFEFQNIVGIKERAPITSIKAANALLRLMSYDYIKNCTIKNISICYYSREDQNFNEIDSMNAELVWRVTFSDNSYVYLVSEDY